MLRRYVLSWAAGCQSASYPLALAVVVLVGTVAAGTGYAPASGATAWGQGAVTNPPTAATAAAHSTAVIQPQEPEALALGPHGDLYIADRARNQILKRRPDGTFVVIAGRGKAGFSGDGGPAVDAELNDPGGMTITRDGTLYFADSQNERIRRISPAGVITTIAGNGRPGPVTSGTPALRATLGDPADVIVGPHGDLYIAAAGSDQILRLSAQGPLARVAGPSTLRCAGACGVGKPATEASPDGPYGLAFDRSGDLYLLPPATSGASPPQWPASTRLDAWVSAGRLGRGPAPGHAVVRG